MLKIGNDVPVGVQSWSFRGLKGNEDNIRALKELGLDSIELCGVHVLVADEKNAADVLKLYTDNGIRISSLGIDRYWADESLIRSRFEFARKAGFKVLGADPDPEAFELIDRLCSEYGVKIAIHNHGRHHRYGYAKQLQEAFDKSSDNIGLCLDVAWAMDAGEDPVAMIKKFSSRLYGIHFKDFAFDAGNDPNEVILGKGDLDLAGVVSALKETGFSGYASIEYEEDEENPVPGISECVQALKDAME